MNYTEFLNNKRITDLASGFNPAWVNPKLFDFQIDITRWAIRRGRSCIFADCGMGKTFIQLEWAREVVDHTKGKCLILAPLAVNYQTVIEGEKLGIKVHICKHQDDCGDGINITNYHRLDHFVASEFGAIVLDESSILKSFTGKFRNQIISSFSNTPYRLACTATPAPNDYMELGNHAEFVGAMTRTEMLSMFFTHDGGETSKWRLKGHAENEFWKWVCSWAVYLRKPSDLGYEDGDFILPALNVHKHVINHDSPTNGTLFAMPAETLQEQRHLKRETIGQRAERCAEIVNNSKDPWIVWCELNDESDTLEKLIPGSVQVKGSDDPEVKEQSLLDFTKGKYRVIVTKPSIAGHGMNWQHCPNQAFVSISHSYESYYQAVRRSWRFGQSSLVNIHIFMSELESPILDNLNRKEVEASRMAENMVAHMKELNQAELKGLERTTSTYEESRVDGNGWSMIQGDCVEVAKEVESESIDYSIFSPPFASLYTYSNSERDMGNCSDFYAFNEHFEFLVPELFRVMKPGRCLSFHCMNLPITKEREGFIGIRDFRGELIRLFIKHGFIYHSEVCIWKDPVTAMQRTKAIGLLYKQLKKDSTISRQGIPDYLVTMRKPGVNSNPVTKKPENFPVSLWQKWASPIWMDIDPSKTLQSIREDRDERHICPLQLEVIERGIMLWSNHGDVVFSPFAGIGSEGYQAILLDRSFLGIELKKAYVDVAVKNLQWAETQAKSQKLF